MKKISKTTQTGLVSAIVGAVIAVMSLAQAIDASWKAGALEIDDMTLKTGIAGMVFIVLGLQGYWTQDEDKS